MRREKNSKKVALVIALAVILLSALPVQAHIPEGWVPIEECSKYCGGTGAGPAGGAAAGDAGTDFSVDVVYRATSDAIDKLWEGEAPRRNSMKIVCNLPNPTAEHVIKVIVGQPAGDAPPEWTSEKPGIYEFNLPAGTSEENLRAENFEFTFVDTWKGKNYTWKAEEEIPGIFPEGYFELRNKKAGGETLKWYEENQLTAMEGKIPGKLTESIGKKISNELHDNYAHHLDEGVVGKASEKGTILYLATKLAETGDKDKYLADLLELVEEADELIKGFHHVAHENLPPLAEETGKGGDVALLLHDNLAHGMMASIFSVSEHLDAVEKSDDIDGIKEKAGEMLEEVKKLKGLTTEVHAHSTDPATVWTEQLPLKLKDGRKTVKIKRSDLTTYLSIVGGEKEDEEPAPIGGAIAFTVLVVGLAAVGIWRHRKGSRK